MKREKSAGGLFGLLARQYLLFTLALLAIAAAVFALWMFYTARIYQAPDWDCLLADPALAEGRWDTLRRHLTPGSGFAVYDGDGALVFSALGYFYVLRRGKSRFAGQFIPTAADLEPSKPPEQAAQKEIRPDDGAGSEGGKK